MVNTLDRQMHALQLRASLKPQLEQLLERQKKVDTDPVLNDVDRRAYMVLCTGLAEFLAVSILDVAQLKGSVEKFLELMEVCFQSYFA